MKRFAYLSVLMLALFACHAQAKRVIRYPLFESSQTPAFKIDSICIDDKETLIYFHYYNEDGTEWINLSANTYIKDRKKEKKYEVLSLDNLAKDPEKTYILDKKEWSGIIHFPHIDSNTIDFIESENNTAFNIYGIDLTQNGESIDNVNFIELNRKLHMADFYFTAKNYEEYIEQATPCLKPLRALLGTNGTIDVLQKLINSHLLTENINKVCESYTEEYMRLCGNKYISYTTKSNEYYSLGIKSYRNKEYDLAKDYFEKCYNEDCATLGNDDYRLSHSISWMARCYYMIGNEENANELCKWYKVEPVDRNKTLESDSLSYIASKYEKSGYLQKALETTLFYASIERKNLGECYWYANTLDIIGGYYWQLNDMKMSMVYLQKALDIRKRFFGEIYIDYVSFYLKKGDILLKSNNYIDATKNYVEALRIFYTLFPSAENKDIISSICNCLCSLGANQISSNFLDTYIISKLPSDLASSLFNVLKMYHFDNNQYNDAEFYANEIYKINKDKNDENELWAIAEYGNLLRLNRKYDEAISVFTFVEQKFNSKKFTDVRYAQSIRELSEIYQIIGNKQKAYDLGTESVNLLKHFYEHNQDFSSITNLSWALKLMAGYCNALGKFNEAKSRIDESVTLLQENKDIVYDYNSRIARSLVVKAKILCDGEDIANALNVINECLSIIKQDSLCSVFDYANALDVYVDICFKNNDRSNAITASNEFISIIKDNIGIYNDRYVNAIEKKASILTFTGDYAAAIQLHEEAAIIAEKIFGKDNMIYASIMNGLSTCKYATGDITSALDISIDLCKNKEIAKKGNETYLLPIISQKAVNEMNLGMIDLAIKDFKLSLDVLKWIEQNVVDSSVTLTNTKVSIYSNLAYAYYLSQETEEAIKALDLTKNLYEQNKIEKTLSYVEMVTLQEFISEENADLYSLSQAKEIVSELLGKNNFMYSNVLMAITKKYIKQENLDSIENYSKQCYDAIINTLENNKLSLTKSLRSMFWNKIRPFFSKDVLQLAAKYKSPKLCSLAYNSSLYFKGFLLHSDNIIKKEVFESKDSVLIEHYKNYERIQNIIAYQDINKVSDNYMSLQDSLKKEQQYILSKINTLNENIYNYHWKDIQKNLKTKDIAIEIVSYDIENDVRYSAICVDKYCESPFLVDISLESSINNMIDFSSEQLSNILQPIQDVLNKYDNAYISCSGKFHSLPIEHFIDSCNVYRVSSTSMICNNHDVDILNASLYGGLDYNIDYTTHAQSSEFHSPSENIMRHGAEYLPETFNEVLEIVDVLKINDISTTLYSKEIGTEDTFKSLSGNSPSIIHLATHGMHVPIERVNEYKDSKNMNFLITSYNSNTTPFEDVLLSHSFLVFSGGNEVLQHKKLSPEVNDGILTALEISKLDLRNTNLVVLSACQSGLGDDLDEGNMGLVYGFKKAGVESMLVSLNNIDDTVTKILMVNFYKNIMNGNSKIKSLKIAQELLKTIDGGKYKDPKYWASFILIDAFD